MFLRSLRSALLVRRSTRRRGCSIPWTRLRVEQLEDRTVLSDLGTPAVPVLADAAIVALAADAGGNAGTPAAPAPSAEEAVVPSADPAPVTPAAPDSTNIPDEVILDPAVGEMPDSLPAVEEGADAPETALPEPDPTIPDSTADSPASDSSVQPTDDGVEVAAEAFDPVEQTLPTQPLESEPDTQAELPADETPDLPSDESSDPPVSGGGMVVVSGDVGGAATADAFVVRLDAADPGLVEVVRNDAVAFAGSLADLDQLTIDGQDGDNSLTVDFSLGNPLPDGGLHFTGGTGSSLLVQGGTFASVSLTPTGPHAGTLSFDDGWISYARLAALTDTTTAAQRTFLGSGGSSKLLGDDGDADNGLSLLQRTDRADTRIAFASPTRGLTVQGSDADDQVAVLTFDPAFHAALTIRAAAIDVQGDVAATDVDLHAVMDLDVAAGASIVAPGGTIALSNAGTTQVAGTLDVSTTAAGHVGGDVKVLGNQVGLVDQARIEASGPAGGGTILVGGHRHGEGPEPSAQGTFVSPDAVLHADAIEAGDGGIVVVWANGVAAYHGSITARGGSLGGDGGFVEVSGKETLVFDGKVDLAAPRGRFGSVLFDPFYLTLLDAQASGEQDAALTAAPVVFPDFTQYLLSLTDPWFSESTLSWGAIDALGATAQVTVEASRITIADVTGAAGGSTTADNLVLLDLVPTLGRLVLQGEVLFEDPNDVIRTEGADVTVVDLNGSRTNARLANFDVTGASGQVVGGTAKVRTPIQLSAVYVRGLQVPGEVLDFTEVAPVDPIDLLGLATSQGRLTARVHATGMDTRLSLFAGNGPFSTLMAQSAAESLGSPDDRLIQSLDWALPPFQPFLRVEGLDGGTGRFVLTTEFETALPPFEPLPVGVSPYWIATADFNGDQHLDLVTANRDSQDVSVLLGLGDGTFRGEWRFPVGGSPVAVAVGDFDGNGTQDLVTANDTTNDITVLFGQGDGTFWNSQRLQVGNGPTAVIASDLNRDGFGDVVTASYDTGQLSIVLSKGDGTFELPQQMVVAGPSPYVIASALVAAHIDADNILDLAATNPYGLISVFLGKGDGQFQDAKEFAVEKGPQRIAAGDFNRDGLTDLATQNQTMYGKAISILLGTGTGDFQPAISQSSGGNRGGLAAADFDRDGLSDLATPNANFNDVSVYLGTGDGWLADPAQYAVGTSPYSIAAGDFNEDGLPDLVTANNFSQDVSVLLGLGDGTFRTPVRFLVGNTPAAITSADFNRDGFLDLATADAGIAKVSVLLGVGDGTYQEQAQFSVGVGPSDIATADFNEDGRPDLVTANPYSSDLSVLLGVGDGSFRDEVRLAAATFGGPQAVVTGDFNGDSHADIATACLELAVSLGNGDGTFQDARVFEVPDGPSELATGDFDNDGRLDLATLHYFYSVGGVLLNMGDGSFPQFRPFSVGYSIFRPNSLAVADFDENGVLDLATANLSGSVSVLPGVGNGTFSTPNVYWQPSPDGMPWAIVAADFNANGHLDLAVANRNSMVSLLTGLGDGTFSMPSFASAGKGTRGLTTGDFNRDGITDLAVANDISDDVTVLLGSGTPTLPLPYTPPPMSITLLDAGTQSSPIQAVPLLADFNRDGAPDVVILNRAGSILYREGRLEEPGTFGAPVVLNPDSPARDITLVPGDQEPIIAGVDAQQDHSTAVPSYPVRFFVPPGSAPITLPDPQAVYTSPSRIEAADLNGDGRADLAVLAPNDGQLSLFYQTALGGFTTELPLYNALIVGTGAADVALVDADGDGDRDVIVPNQVAGDVAVFPHEDDTVFGPISRYRAGTSLYGMQPISTTTAVRSLDRTTAVLAGLFDLDGTTDLIALNTGANQLALLPGRGDGTFVSPEIVGTGMHPTFIRAAHLDGDQAVDLAVLTQDQIEIYQRDAAGNYRQTFVIAAGNVPSGFTIDDLTGDGKLDLVVGNDYGDVLLLPGLGNGQFQPYQRAGSNIALAVTDLDGDGADDFIFGNESRDRVAVQYGSAGAQVFRDRQDGLLAPGAVRTGDLNGDGQGDLIVANSGSNNVLVYLGTGNGQFGTEANGGKGFFAGTNPAGVTIADLQNGDSFLDLVVANYGSNDVSVLYGKVENGTWRLDIGPRLEAGSGPVATLVQDVTGGPGNTPDGIPDILATNSISNSASLVPGIAGGFFNDGQATDFTTGLNPQQALVGNFDGAPGLDLVTVNAGSNDLTFFTDFLSAKGPGTSVGSGGTGPVAAADLDFNLDGLRDLVVINNGNGSLALFQGSGSGLGLVQAITSTDLLRPTDVVIAGVTDQAVQIYVTTEGQEQAFLEEFLLDANAPLPGDITLGGGVPDLAPDLDPFVPGPPETGLPPTEPVVPPEEPPGDATGQPTIELTPLDPGGTGVVVVPVVTSGSGFLPSSIDGPLRAGTELAALAGGEPLANGDEAVEGENAGEELDRAQLAALLVALIGGGDDGTVEDDLAETVAEPGTLESFVTGLEESFGREMQAARQRLLGDGIDPRVVQRGLEAAVQRLANLLDGGQTLGLLLLELFSAPASGEPMNQASGSSMLPPLSGAVVDTVMHGLIETAYGTGTAAVDLVETWIRSWLSEVVSEPAPELSPAIPLPPESEPVMPEQTRPAPSMSSALPLLATAYLGAILGRESRRGRAGCDVHPNMPVI